MQTHLLEEALTVISSPQVLVNVISRRVRQLTVGHRALVEVEIGMGFCDTALKEVILGKISYEAAGPATILSLPTIVVGKLAQKAA